MATLAWILVGSPATGKSLFAEGLGMSPKELGTGERLWSNADGSLQAYECNSIGSEQYRLFKTEHPKAVMVLFSD